MRVLTVLLALACPAAMADQTPAPAGAAVYNADYTHTPFVANVASSRITITVTK